MKLIYISLSWLIGIILGMWFGFQWIIIPIVYTIAVVAFLTRRRRSLLFLLCLVFLLGGIIRYESTVAHFDESSISFYNDRGTVQMEGLVADDPDPTDRAVGLKIEASKIRVDDSWKDVNGSVLVYAPQFPSSDFFSQNPSRDPPYYRYGDVVHIEGELKTPQKLDDFDWQAYLANRGIHSVMSRPETVILVDYGKGFAPRYWLSQLRERMSEALASALHEPQGALAQAIVLGERSSLPDELRESFARTGTSHMIAISGLHIAIAGGIALALGASLFGRVRPYYFILAMVAIWGYALLTGLHAPALRAAIMVSLWLFGDHIGRPRSAMTSLLFAAAIMVGISPSILSDVSFQMSFTAMAGLMLLTPRFQSLGSRLFRVDDEGKSARRFVVDSVAVTLGAVIATLPIIAFYFDQISIVVLLANMVALPALPFVIGSSAVVAVIGMGLPAVANVIGWVAWLFMSYMIETIEFFASWPFASVGVEVGAAFVWVYYAVLGLVLVVISNRQRLASLVKKLKIPLVEAPNVAKFVPARLVMIGLLVMTSLTWTAAVTMPDGRLHIYFLDVGQGDAILIQRGYHQILIDGGPDAERLCVELGGKLPFWDRTIENVILTHPDSDHITGLIEVLQRYEVDHILANGQPCASALCEEWQRQIRSHELTASVAEWGQVIHLGEDLCLEVIHPLSDAATSGADTNDNSVVTRLVFEDFSILLTGDITEPVEQVLIGRNCTLASTVLKVAHHGSGGSSCMEFIDVVEPQVAVVSVGADNTYGHPDPDVMARLASVAGEKNVYTTTTDGTVELITDGWTLWVKTER